MLTLKSSQCYNEDDYRILNFDSFISLPTVGVDAYCEMITMFEDHYPETLKYAIVINGMDLRFIEDISCRLLQSDSINPYCQSD